MGNSQRKFVANLTNTLVFVDGMIKADYFNEWSFFRMDATNPKHASAKQVVIIRLRNPRGIMIAKIEELMEFFANTTNECRDMLRKWQQGLATNKEGKKTQGSQHKKQEHKKVSGSRLAPP